MAKIIPIKQNANIMTQGLSWYLKRNPDGLHGLHMQLVHLINDLTYSCYRETVRISCREMAYYEGYYTKDVYQAVRYLIKMKIIIRYPQIDGTGKFFYGLHPRWLPDPRPRVTGYQIKAIK